MKNKVPRSEWSITEKWCCCWNSWYQLPVL